MDTLATTELVARGSANWVGPGLTGFVVIAMLGVAVYALWRSMNQQLRKVRFDERDATTPSTTPSSMTSTTPPTGSPAGSATERTADHPAGGRAEPNGPADKAGA